ncbi:MAG TPA: DUF6355 family natural product biosynthesis protein [Actinokineospora sp.]|nr:DUF6355 family natural product biosynthesis protein [Actinokineospora sp.]
MNSNRIRAALVAVTAAASVLGTPDQATAAPGVHMGVDWKCGFYLTPTDPEQTRSRYFHCGNNFISIQAEWSNGARPVYCIKPWENHPFWWDGPYVVVNAYYVPVVPRLRTGPSGRLECND